MKRILVNLKDHQHSELKREAFAKDTSISDIIRKAIDKRKNKTVGVNMRLIPVDHDLLKEVVNYLEGQGENELKSKLQDQLNESDYDLVSGIKLT